MKSCITCAAAGGVLLVAAMAVPFAVGGESGTYTLQSNRRPGQIDHVVSLFEAEGTVSEDAAPKGGKTAKAETATIVCKRDYDEKTLEIGGAASRKWRAVRHYDQASAELKMSKSEVLKPALRADRRLIVVEVAGQLPTYFCPHGALTREELEVLETVGNSLVLDQLLPEGPVSVGQKWKYADAVFASLLGLEEITSNDVEAVLKEVTPEVARMEIRGRVAGRMFGAVTRLELLAKCRFDRTQKRIDWFAMRVTEKRGRSLVEGAMDFIAKLQVRILPREESKALSAATLKDLPLEATTAMCLLSHEPSEGDWRLLHDRNWHLLDSHRDTEIFNRVERGQHIGVCRITKSPKAADGKAGTLDEFKEEVQRALGKNLKEIVESVELPSEAKYRIYRVIAAGGDQQGPARWHYYRVSDALGRQVSFTFHVGQQQAEAFGKAGDELVQGLRFVEPKGPAKGSSN